MMLLLLVVDAAIVLAWAALWIRHQLRQRAAMRACRVCGCTDDRACITALGPCHWIGADLCSACPTPTDVHPRRDAAPSLLRHMHRSPRAASQRDADAHGLAATGWAASPPPPKRGGGGSSPSG